MPLANLHSHRQFFHEPNAVHTLSNSSLRQRDKCPEIHIQRTTDSYFLKWICQGTLTLSSARQYSIIYAITRLKLNVFLMFWFAPPRTCELFAARSRLRTSSKLHHLIGCYSCQLELTNQRHSFAHAVFEGVIRLVTLLCWRCRILFMIRRDWQNYFTKGQGQCRWFGTKMRSLHGCVIVNLTSFVSTFVVTKIHTDMYTHTIRTIYCHNRAMWRLNIFFLLLI